MVCHLKSLEGYGISARVIDVEIDIHRGLPAMHIVGLADRALQESKLRVFSAIKNSGYKIPMQKIIVNLAPAYLYKSGTSHDLAIALGLLIASRQIDLDRLKDKLTHTAFWGELDLNGGLVEGIGALPVALATAQNHITNLILPGNNAEEAGNVAGINCYALKDLSSVIAFLTDNNYKTTRCSAKHNKKNTEKNYSRFEDLKGNYIAKRAMEIAAAGGHNILLVGPPGVGKTALCESLTGILPELNSADALEVACIQSAAGISKGKVLINPPFRAPHHTTSVASLVGGGVHMKPGEIVLANKGVLFFDECNLFDPKALDVLREPLESKTLRITKYNSTCNFPADFMFVAAMNPCLCGNYGSKERKCTCSMAQINNFRKRMPVPLLNRIDLQIVMENESDFVGNMGPVRETSESIRLRVGNARRIQQRRGKLNSALSLQELKEYAALNDKALLKMEQAISVLNLSPRAQIRLWRVSRTIADLAGSNNINEKHISEAVCYRLS